MVEDQIVSMKRRVTKENSRPMWECSTANGRKLYVIRHHTNPDRDQAHFFDASGHMPFMLNLALDQVVNWQTHPIGVELYQDGDFWKIQRVTPLGDGEGPDAAVMPNGTLARAAVIAWASQFILLPHFVIWDTETTGVQSDDEILSIGITDSFGEKFQYLIEPENLDRVERLTHIHGLTCAEVEGQGKFPEYYPLLSNLLNGVVWGVYNASFDPKMLEQVCLRQHLPPILPVATVDVMEMYARFYGEWDAQYGRWKTHKLEEAASFLGLAPRTYHSALDDALTTRDIIQAMARWQEPS